MSSRAQQRSVRVASSNGFGSDEIRIAMLSPKLLLAAARTKGGVPDKVLATFPGASRVHRLDLQGARGDENEDLTLLCMELPHFREMDETTYAAAAGDEATLTPLLRMLCGLSAESRADAMSFVLHAAAASTGSWSGALSGRLFACRQLLRERLPRTPLTPDGPRAAYVDSLLAVDQTSFLIAGWLYDDEAAIVRATAVTPEGSRAELWGDLYLHPRPDVASFFAGRHSPAFPATGFRCFFTTEHPSRLRQGWVLELQNANGDVLEVDMPTIVDDPEAVRDAILAGLVVERLPKEELRGRHALPALSRLEERRRQRVEVVSVDQWGGAPASPDVTIVVPLYRRIDFVEHQLAQFSLDSDLHQADLIYVLDSPELSEQFRLFTEHLHELYRLPFRAVVLSENGGFSTANNIGASLGRGRLLLLLNSDVLPDRPGWLSRMREFHDSRPNVGAVGAKLLYEDESLQHAGLYFQRRAGSTLWNNEHHFKGLHRHFAPADVPREVDAVSAACLMIDRALYESLGGLRGIYVQGDYEDSDLCLRLLQGGRENWYVPEVELFHLEAQSYPGEQRLQQSEYNRWLQTHLWDDQIRQIVAAGDAQS